VLFPVSTSIVRMRAEVRSDRDPSTVTLTTALERPRNAGRQFTWCGSLQNGSPLPTPITRPGPETISNVTLAVDASTGTPRASTMVARTNATSWPSSTSFCPVAVVLLGASSCSKIATAAPVDVTRECVATAFPPGTSLATAVTLPASHVVFH